MRQGSALKQKEGRAAPGRRAEHRCPWRGQPRGSGLVPDMRGLVLLTGWGPCGDLPLSAPGRRARLGQCSPSSESNRFLLGPSAPTAVPEDAGVTRQGGRTQSVLQQRFFECPYWATPTATRWLKRRPGSGQSQPSGVADGPITTMRVNER